MAAGNAGDPGQRLVADALQLLDGEDGENQVELAVGERQIGDAAGDEIDPLERLRVGHVQQDVVGQLRRYLLARLQLPGDVDTIGRQVDAGEYDFREMAG